MKMTGPLSKRLVIRQTVYLICAASMG